MPSPLRRKKDDDPFEDLFADFDREFRRMQDYMNQVFAQAMKQADQVKGDQPGNPFMYGFTLRLGPDGRPHIEQFGNTPRALRSPEIAAEGGREPVTDLIEHADHFSLTVELPGVEKEDVQVFGTEDRLTVKVDTAARKYYKEVSLPAKVKPDTTEATFKNGILDVQVRKQQRRPPADRGTRVNVK